MKTVVFIGYFRKALSFRKSTVLIFKIWFGGGRGFLFWTCVCEPRKATFLMVALWCGKIQLFSIVFEGMKKEKKIVEDIGFEPMSQVSKTCMIDRYTNLLSKDEEF